MPALPFQLRREVNRLQRLVPREEMPNGMIVWRAGQPLRVLTSCYSLGRVGSLSGRLSGGSSPVVRSNPIAGPPSNALEQWRERVLNALLAVTAGVGVPLALFGAWTAFGNRHRFVSGFLLLVAGSIVAAAIARHSAYRARALLLVAVIFAVGLESLQSYGLAGASLLAFFAAIALAATLLGIRFSSGFLLLSLASMALAKVSFDAGWLVAGTPEALGIYRWIGMGSALLVLAGVVTLSQTILLKRLSTSLEETDRARSAFRASEAQWRSLVDNAPDVIVIVNRDHRIEFGNRSGLGYERDQLEGASVLDFVAGEDRDALRDAIDSVFETGEYASAELGVVTPDGEPHWFSTRLGPVRRGDEIDRVTLIATEVTERRSLEEQLQQSQKLEAVGQLTGGVAHDFNNLLTVILGSLEIASSCDESELSTELEAATEAALRGAELTNRLLAFSRRQPLRARAVDLGDLLAGMHPLLLRTLGETIEIRMISRGELWTCHVDPGQLEQVILNLAINARDAMPGGGLLTIETQNVELGVEEASRYEELGPGQYVRVTVSDTGVGMTPEAQRRAFDPFFTTKEPGQGTGLGLSMVYGFLKQSGGHVAIVSERGRGTSLHLHLPCAGAEASGELRPALRREVVPAGHAELVLVVEDDPSVRALTIRMLQGLGYRTCEAPDARSALETLHGVSGISLLFTDVVLSGGMSGVELAREAAKLLPDVQVLFASGYAQEAFRNHDPLDPDVDLLEKPFSRADLAQHVQAALLGLGLEAGG